MEENRLNRKILFTFVSLVVVAVIISTSVTYSFFPRIVEKEVPIEVPQESFTKNFDIRESPYIALQFGDNNFKFIDGDFSSCYLDWYGYWDSKVTIIGSSITNCTIYLTNLDLELENCTVENCNFEGTFNSATYIYGTSFVGTTIFNISVVNGTGNIGLENVIFNGDVFQGD